MEEYMANKGIIDSQFDIIIIEEVSKWNSITLIGLTVISTE